MGEPELQCFIDGVEVRDGDILFLEHQPRRGLLSRILERIGIMRSQWVVRVGEANNADGN